MQKVAAYLLERKGNEGSSDGRADEARQLRDTIKSWLESKGGDSSALSGKYQPDDGSTGNFWIEDADDGDRRWWMCRLEEVTQEGRRFRASASVTAGRRVVSVYITLEVGWTATQLAPVIVDPRCPRLVRELLALAGPWYHGSSRVHGLWDASDFDHGQFVVGEIEDQTRTLPLIVVSVRNDDLVMERLDEKVAFDLAGLANVVRLGEEASWALTDALGQRWSCFSGGVRIYWPRFSTSQDRYAHPLWTGERLVATGGERMDVRERFRKQLRSLVFRASALSVTRPHEIDEIRDAADQSAVAALEEAAATSQDHESLASWYASDNGRLRGERDDLREQLTELQQQLSQVSAQRDALRDHLRAVDSGRQADSVDEIAPTSGESAESDSLPEDGEIRFYKKRFSTPNHDVMVRVGDCGHNNWEGAHSADKAKKGVSKLEGGRTDWSRVQHCASCTGGGMWKVRW